MVERRIRAVRWMAVCLALAAAPLAARADEFREQSLRDAAKTHYQEHVLYGPPDRTAVVVRRGYVLGYAPRQRAAAWVAYHVKPEYLLDAERYRGREFVGDPDVREAPSAQELGQNLGAESVLVRLAPLEVMGGDRADAIDEAGYTANVVPMHRSLVGEKCLWRRLQQWVQRDLVQSRKLEVWVLAGCVFGAAPAPAAADAIPMFFQIVAVPGETDDRLQVIAFLIPHQRQPRGSLASFVTPLKTIETLTGLEFFPELDEDVKQRLADSDAGQTWRLALPSDEPVAAARAVERTPGPPKSKPAVTDKAVGPGREKENIVRVFYGTDRARNPSADGPNDFYGPDRGSLEYGVCEVSVPPGHQAGELERPVWWRLEFREDPLLHVVLQRVTPAAEPREFFADLRQNVAGRETFIFVHGYNNSFMYAAHRTAQMAVDLQMRYAPLMYSWPSQNSLEGYGEDERQVERSVENFRRFLGEVANQSGASRIHLIAHSMGTRLLAGALEELKSEKAVEFNEIILAAPDIRADDFRNEIAPRIHGLGSRITVYASHKDKALLASKYFHELLGLTENATRLGAGLIDLTPFRRIEQVDASRVDTSVMGHAYYGDESPLLKDISRVLQGDRPPQRKLQSTRFGYLIPDPLDVAPTGWPLERWGLLALVAVVGTGWLWRRRKRRTAG